MGLEASGEAKVSRKFHLLSNKYYFNAILGIGQNKYFKVPNPFLTRKIPMIVHSYTFMNYPFKELLLATTPLQVSSGTLGRSLGGEINPPLTILVFFERLIFF